MRLSWTQSTTASRQSTLVYNQSTLFSRSLLLLSLLSLCAVAFAADANAQRDQVFRHRRTFAHNLQARSHQLQARTAQELDFVDSSILKREPQFGRGGRDDDDDDDDRRGGNNGGFGNGFGSWNGITWDQIIAWGMNSWNEFLAWVARGSNVNELPRPPTTTVRGATPSRTTATPRATTPPQNPAPAPTQPAPAPSPSPNPPADPPAPSPSPESPSPDPSTPSPSSSSTSTVRQTTSSRDTTSSSSSSAEHVSQTSDPGSTGSTADSGKKNNTGLIIGLVIGLLVLLGICCAFGFFFAKKRRERQINEKAQTESYTSQTWLARTIGKTTPPPDTFTKAEEAGSPITPSSTTHLVLAAAPPAAVYPAAESSGNRYLEPVPIAATRPQTPSSYMESEFSDDNKSFSFRHYEPDPRIGVPVDYPLALHVPPRVAKAIAKQDVVRQANPVRPVSPMTASTVPDPNHPMAKKRSSYFAVPPSARTSCMSYTPGTDSSNGASMGHIPPVPTPPVTGDTTRMDPVAAAMMRYSVASYETGTSDLPSPTLPPAVYRPMDNSRRGISNVLGGGNGTFGANARKRASAPLPPIPQDAVPPQEADPFSSNSRQATPTPSPPPTPGVVKNPFARPLSQGSMMTDESAATIGGRTEEVGGLAVASRVMTSPASRVVYSIATNSDRSSSSGASTILAYNTRNSGSNPFDDAQGIPEEQTMVVEVNPGDSWRSGPRVNTTAMGNIPSTSGHEASEEAYAGIVALDIESSIAGSHEVSTFSHPENPHRKSLILAFPSPPSPTNSR